jgi:hypothetical protein
MPPVPGAFARVSESEVRQTRRALSSNRLIEIAEAHPHHRAEKRKARDQAK